MKTFFDLVTSVTEGHVPKFQPKQEEQLDEALTKADKRLTILVRSGLMDTKDLPIIQRAMKNLNADKGITNVAEREVLQRMLANLLDIVTGDDTVFNRIRMDVRNKDAE